MKSQKRIIILIVFLIAAGLLLAWLDNGPRKEKFEQIDVDSLPSRFDE